VRRGITIRLRALALPVAPPRPVGVTMSEGATGIDRVGAIAAWTPPTSTLVCLAP